MKKIIEKIKEKKQAKRVPYLDVLRVIACLAVVLLHSSAPFVKPEEVGSINWWVGNVFDGISRIAVPLFIMISGALMLDENYDFSKKKMIGHIKKMGIFFIFWSVVYCLVFKVAYPLLMHNPVSIKSIFGALIKGHYHLWFCYLIVGLYLIVPLLRLWVRKDNKKYVEYFLVLSIIFTFIIPQIISVLGNCSKSVLELSVIADNYLRLSYVGGFVPYFILGWYLNNYEIRRKKLLYGLGVIGVLTTIFGTYILTLKTGEEVSMYNSLYLNVLLEAIAIFVFVKNMVKKESGRVVKVIAKHSLGVYAIHAAIIFALYAIPAFKNNGLIGIPAAFVIALSSSMICSFIMSKIPLLKKIV